ncbi:MAG: pilus assembly protein TadG-related protein [Planctomycetota bacterium]|jgi:Flp pilus assembly protein TadG
MSTHATLSRTASPASVTQLHPLRSQRGATLIMVAILGLFLIGILGIAMDASYVLTTAQQLQRAADASSLAAARLVKFEADPFNPTNTFPLSRDAAVQIALQNEAAADAVQLQLNDANATDGDIVIGIWDDDSQTFTPDLLTPNSVRVRARRTSTSLGGTLNLFFGPFFGTAVTDVERTATAVLAPAEQALILVLDNKVGALKLVGTVFMEVHGKIHANSTMNCGIQLNGQPDKVLASQTSVVGTVCDQHDTITGGPIVEGADHIPDPLEDLLPDLASWNAFKAGLDVQPGSDGLGAITSAGTYPPGYYPGGISLSSSDIVTLDPSSNPGNPYYMFGNNGVTLHGSSFVMGDNVTVFIDQGAAVDISGSGAGADLSAPTSGPFQGIAFFHYRENNGNPESKITGGGLFKIEGLIYAAAGELILGGNPGKEIGAIIVGSLTNHGVTGFTITGNGIPPAEGEEYTFLVE